MNSEDSFKKFEKLTGNFIGALKIVGDMNKLSAKTGNVETMIDDVAIDHNNKKLNEPSHDNSSNERKDDEKTVKGCSANDET